MRCLKGAKKMLGDSKQKARPVTLLELEQLVTGLQPTIKDAAYRVPVLCALWGAVFGLETLRHLYLRPRTSGTRCGR